MSAVINQPRPSLGAPSAEHQIGFFTGSAEHQIGFFFNTLIAKLVLGVPRTGVVAAGVGVAVSFITTSLYRHSTKANHWPCHKAQP